MTKTNPILNVVPAPIKKISQPVIPYIAKGEKTVGRSGLIAAAVSVPVFFTLAAVALFTSPVLPVTHARRLRHDGPLGGALMPLQGACEKPLMLFVLCVSRQVWMFFGLITSFFWVPVVIVGALFVVSATLVPATRFRMDTKTGTWRFAHERGGECDSIVRATHTDAFGGKLPELAPLRPSCLR